MAISIQRNQSGFSVVEAVLLFVIVSILGFTGWYVLQVKQNVNKSLNSNHSTTPKIGNKKTTSKNVTTQIPNNWMWYDGDGFKFVYPKAYGAFIAENSTPAQADVLRVYKSGQPDPPYVGTSNLPITITVLSPDASFGTFKYGPTVAYQNGLLIVKDTNPADSLNNVGQEYQGSWAEKQVVKQSNDGLQLYRIEGGDEGNVSYTYSFIVNNKVVNVQLPMYGDGEMCPESGCQNPIADYDAFAKVLRDSISTTK